MKLTSIQRFSITLAAIVPMLVVTIAQADDCANTNAMAYQPTRVEANEALVAAATGSLGADYPRLPNLVAGFPDYRMVPGSIACPIPQAIAWIESGWRQASATAQGATGPVLTGGGGCGVGMMQVSTGMRYAGELPRATQMKIASDYEYNAAQGLQLLASKWNETPIIGSNDPTFGESWYYAIWAYNAWSFKNNPNNPDFPSVRPTYDGTQPVRNYPYQELVFGLAANPPKSAGQPLWQSVPLSLPDRGAIGSSPDAIPAPSVLHQSVCSVARLAALPTSLSFIADPGRMANSRQVNIDGSGSWSLKTGASWLSASPMSGPTLPAVVTVTAATESLGTGIHTSAFDVVAGEERLTVPVRAQVGNLKHLYLPSSSANRN